MFRGQKAYDEIRQKIDCAVGDVLGEYQDKYGMSGDIEPLQALAYDETIDKLAEIVADVLQFEFDYFRP